MGLGVEVPGAKDEKNRLLGSLIHTWIAEGNKVILRNARGEDVTLDLKE